MILKCWTIDDVQASEAKIIFRLDIGEDELNILEIFTPRIVEIPFASTIAYIDSNFDLELVNFPPIESSPGKAKIDITKPIDYWMKVEYGEPALSEISNEIFNVLSREIEELFSHTSHQIKEFELGLVKKNKES